MIQKGSDPNCTDVTVDLASGIASVQGSASDESIISVITERGYTAKRK